MIIDPHNHVLGNAVPPGHELFKSHMLRHLAPDELPTSGRADGEVPPWLAPVDPERLIAEHREAGVDLSVVLALAPSDYTEYGERGTVEITMVMGDYAMTAMLLNAVNQQLPADWEPLLPMP